MGEKRSRKKPNLNRIILAWIFALISVALWEFISLLPKGGEDWVILFPLLAFLGGALLAMFFGFGTKDWAGYIPAIIGAITWFLFFIPPLIGVII